MEVAKTKNAGERSRTPPEDYKGLECLKYGNEEA
jgi:hypothetical protein